MHTENDIDGEALSMLLNNFEEFRHLVPKSGYRMKIKFIIQQQHCEHLQVGIQESCSSVPPQV